MKTRDRSLRWMEKYICARSNGILSATFDDRETIFILTNLFFAAKQEQKIYFFTHQNPTHTYSRACARNDVLSKLIQLLCCGWKSKLKKKKQTKCITFNNNSQPANYNHFLIRMTFLFTHTHKLQTAIETGILNKLSFEWFL